MEWFSGSITDAIAKAKAADTLFVVAVHGPEDDEKTKGFLASLDDPRVSGLIRGAGAVAIKIEGGTDLCKQFSAIYPVVVVPAVYFIDSGNGVNLEVAACEGKGPEDIAKSVLKANEAIQKRRIAESLTSPRRARVEEATRTLEETSHLATATNVPVSSGVSSSSSVPVSAPPTASASAPASAPTEASDSGQRQLSLEERVARAKELLAQKKAIKEASDQNKEVSGEVQRRELGRQMQQMKRDREENERRAAVEERKRDREEEKIAREKVRQQIIQDRAERAARYSKEKEAEAARLKEEERKRLLKQAEEAQAEKIAKSSVARIQFRLPDGRSQTSRFEPDDQLQVLYTFVDENLTLNFSAYTLSTTFPRLQLDEKSRGNTLRQLGLVPSATVLVLPKTGGVVASSEGGGALVSKAVQLFWFALTPLTLMWTFICGFLFPNAGGTRAGRPQAGMAGQSAQPRQAPQRHNRSQGFSRDGNITRLRAGEDDDDETNTYNGNSTQQM